MMIAIIMSMQHIRKGARPVFESCNLRTSCWEGGGLVLGGVGLFFRFLRARYHAESYGYYAQSHLGSKAIHFKQTFFFLTRPPQEDKLLSVGCFSRN